MLKRMDADEKANLPWMRRVLQTLGVMYDEIIAEAIQDISSTSESFTSPVELAIFVYDTAPETS